MPNIQPDAVAVRAPAHSVRVFASVFVGAVVATGTIFANASNYTIDVPISYTSGSHTDVHYGMEVVFTTAGGLFKGRTHVRYAGVINVSNLPVREFSPAVYNLQIGDLITIYDEFRLHDKLVAATTSFDPDYLAYVDQNLHPPPVTCSGGYYANFVDGYFTQTVPELYATVQFTGSTSYTVDPASSGAGTHSWVFPAGSVPTTSASANPSVQIPVGSWVVEHTFTDSTNSKSTTQHVIVMVHDDSFPPYELMLEQGIQTDEQYGWRATARLFENASLTDIPDGAPILLWTAERIGGDWQSFGNVTPGRENMLVVGYAHGDSNTAEAAIKKVYFDIVSPLQRLDEIAGYSKAMIESATPDAWSKINTLKTGRATIQLVYFYTTFIESGFDLIFDSGYLDKTYPALYLQRSTPIQQVRELANGVDARVTCDPTGRIDIYTHPAYIPLASRAAVTVTFTLANEDVINFSFSRLHYNHIELMKTSGFTAGSSPQPIFSLYPGNAPGEATDAPTRDRLICDDQTDLNDRTGRYGALIDNVFINADGLWQRAFELKLTLFGSYNFFRLYHEYVQFTIDGTSNLRGIDLSGFRWWVKSVQVTYDGGTARVALVLQSETNANAGTTWSPPPNVLPPSTVPILPPVTLTPDAGVLSSSTNNLAGINTDGYLYRTGTFQRTNAQGGPSWSRVSLGLSDAIIDGVQNAFQTSSAIVVTVGTNAIYAVDNLSGTPTVTLRKTLRAAISDPSNQWREVDASFGGDSYIVVISYYDGPGADAGTWETHSLDGGITWSTETNITAFYYNGSGVFAIGLFVSSRNPGQAELNAYSSTGGGSNSGIYRLSGTFGSPTLEFPAVGFNGLACIHRSWANNEQSLYFSTTNDALGSQYTIYRKDGSGSLIDITPTISASRCVLRLNRSLHTCPVDANTVLATVRTSGSDSGVVMSRNQGGNWTKISAGTMTDYNGAEVYGNSRDGGIVWGNSGEIGAANLVSGSIDGRKGNLGTFSPGRFVRVMGL